jgi:hypothetical protein
VSTVPFPGRGPRLFGHRGAAGVTPENTLVSFNRALADGADVLELDVHATADGEIVVLHDPTLERTTDGAGPVAAHTWSEVARLDAGFHFTADGGRSFPFAARVWAYRGCLLRECRGCHQRRDRQLGPSIVDAVDARPQCACARAARRRANPIIQQIRAAAPRSPPASPPAVAFVAACRAVTPPVLPGRSPCRSRRVSGTSRW